MNKKIVFSLVVFALTNCVFAGGILENTNQSINFLRNPARDAAIATDGVYCNPAGVAFMDEGWHMQFNWMMVHQDRDTWSGYELPQFGNLLPYNAEKPTTAASNFRRKYEGDVNVPFQPSLFLVYNRNAWSFHFGFGFVGGGGGCEFKNGLGSFESLAALSGIKTLADNGMMLQNYTIETYMKGTSYDLGFTIGAARKFSNKLSGYLGLRSIVLLNKYEGYMRNISYTATNGFTAKGNDLLLDCKQNAFGLAPILGIDYMPNEKWNFALKYEMRTKLTAKTSADNNEAFNQLAAKSDNFKAYSDGAETPQDLPAYLTFGIQYSPISSLKLSGGYHRYFDADTRQYSQEKVDDTNEMTLGVEYKINKAIEASCGMQKTWYHVSDDFNNDANFILNSYTLGCGVGINVSKNIKINAAYFQTNYKNKEITATDANGMTSNIKYRRTNRLLGIGIDIDF